VAGYKDRPNLDYEMVRKFLKDELASIHPQGSARCVGFLGAIELLEELHRYRRDYHAAMVRKDDLIMEARAEAAVEAVNHYATRVLLERAERLIVTHRMKEDVGDHSGGGGQDPVGGEGVRDGELRPGRGQDGDDPHSALAGSDRPPEEAAGSRVQGGSHR